MLYVIKIKKTSSFYRMCVARGYKQVNYLKALFKWVPATKDFVVMGTFDNIAQLIRSKYLVVDLLGKEAGEPKVLPEVEEKPHKKSWFSSGDEDE